MTKYWFTFEIPRPNSTGNLRFFLGVTALDRFDADRLLLQFVFPTSTRLPSTHQVVENIHCEDLEQNHIVANSTNMNAYGIWYPGDLCGHTSFVLPGEESRILFPVLRIGNERMERVPDVSTLTKMRKCDLLRCTYYDWIIMDSGGMVCRIARANSTLAVIPFCRIRVPSYMWIAPDPGTATLSQLKSIVSNFLVPGDLSRRNNIADAQSPNEIINCFE
jgi:hypothetical protein